MQVIVDPAPRAAGGDDAPARSRRRGAGSARQGAASPTCVAHLLDQGTTTRSAQQIADQIDSIGGALGTGSGTDLTFVNVVVMKDSFDVGMDLVGDVVRNPAFAAEEIERQQRAGDLVAAGERPTTRTTSRRRCSIGWSTGSIRTGCPGAARRRRSPASRATTCGSSTGSYFVPNNMILAIVGDVTGEDAFARPSECSATGRAARCRRGKPIDPPPPTRRIVIVDKPDAVQTEIRVGQLADSAQASRTIWPGTWP